MKNRRKLLIALGASALAAPLACFAQQKGKVWRVGFLSPRGRPVSFDPDYLGDFTHGMRDLGYVEGKNLVLEWRFADGKFERLPGMAAELVQLKVDVIVTLGTPATSAAQKATNAIPIVMGTVSDPVGSGFVKSLARPGGNITGLSDLRGELNPKNLDILLSMVPKLSRVAVLVNPDNPSHAGILKSVQRAAQQAGVKVLAAQVRSAQELENAFSAMTRENAGAVIVAGGGFFAQHRHQIAELTAKYRLPSISAGREYAEAGGLMSYGQNRADQSRHAATYVDKILKGAKPADLPVELPIKFDLVINRKTAKALGLTIPHSLLISADKVIE